MSVTLRPYRAWGWEVDITIRLPDGSQYRERKRASRFSKSAAQRWAQDRERHLLQHGPPDPKEVPTLEAFAPRFVDGHARANRHKPSGIAGDRIDPEMASGSHARCEASRRDHQRTGAAAEARAEAPGTEDRQQRADGVEHAAEEGRGVGRARQAAVHDQVVAQSEEDDGVSRLRGVRAVVDGRPKRGAGGVSHGAVGRGCGTSAWRNRGARMGRR